MGAVDLGVMIGGELVGDELGIKLALDFPPAPTYFSKSKSASINISSYGFKDFFGLFLCGSSWVTIVAPVEELSPRCVLTGMPKGRPKTGMSSEP